MGANIRVVAKPVRYQHQRCLHFITFSCYGRMQLLDSAAAREIFERDLASGEGGTVVIECHAAGRRRGAVGPRLMVL